MKKVYELPEMERVVLETQDIITASTALIMGTHHAGEASSAKMETAWKDELGL